MKPYALADGEGRRYEWRGIPLTIKAAGAETGGALALWDVTTRPGEEPHTHTHDDVDELFYYSRAPSPSAAAKRRSN